MRSSMQRDAILQVVKNSKEHPTAVEVYEKAREMVPSIGISTVYRNLSKMVEDGDLALVSFPGEPERYDSTLYNHGHAICERCNKVFDITMSQPRTENTAFV